MNRKENERPRHLKLAWWSLAFGVFALADSMVWPSAWTLLALMAAVVCGHVSRYRIRRSGGQWSGMNTALLGCVLGYGTLVVALLIPTVCGNGVETGRAVTTMNNGRNLYVSLFARGLEDPLAPDSPWPQQDEEKGHVFANSTEFFRWVVTAKVMNVDFSFFSGPRMQIERSQDASKFMKESNAWCVVTGVTSNTPEGMPVLFTTDLGVTNLLQLAGPIRDTVDKGGPFGGRYLVLVENGGQAKLLRRDRFREKWEDVLTNYDVWYGDHPVLRP